MCRLGLSSFTELLDKTKRKKSSVCKLGAKHGPFFLRSLILPLRREVQRRVRANEGGIERVQHDEVGHGKLEERAVACGV